VEAGGRLRSGARVSRVRVRARVRCVRLRPGHRCLVLRVHRVHQQAAGSGHSLARNTGTLGTAAGAALIRESMPRQGGAAAPTPMRIHPRRLLPERGVGVWMAPRRGCCCCSSGAWRSGAVLAAVLVACCCGASSTTLLCRVGITLLFEPLRVAVRIAPSVPCVPCCRLVHSVGGGCRARLGAGCDHPPARGARPSGTQAGQGRRRRGVGAGATSCVARTPALPRPRGAGATAVAACSIGCHTCSVTPAFAAATALRRP